MRCPRAHALRRLRIHLRSQRRGESALTDEHREVAERLEEEIRQLQSLEAEWRRRLPGGPRLEAFQEAVALSHRWWRALELEAALKAAEKAWRASQAIRRALPLVESLRQAVEHLRETVASLPARLTHLPVVEGQRKILGRAEEKLWEGAYDSAAGLLNLAEKALEMWKTLPAEEDPQGLGSRIERARRRGSLDEESHHRLEALIDEGFPGLACRLLDELVTERLSDGLRRRSRGTTPRDLSRLRRRADQQRRFLAGWTREQGQKGNAP